MFGALSPLAFSLSTPKLSRNKDTPKMFCAIVNVTMGQPQRHQTLPSEVARFRPIDTIELLGGFAFLAYIERLGRLETT
jgi:hypothetical protein